jgi:hypothetical protein
MDVVDYTITCSQCKKKMGVISLVYYGVQHNYSPDTMICVDCLPARLVELKKEGYNPETIKRIEKWMDKSNGK